MITWAEFTATQPVLAAAGAGMFYAHEVGLGFLATSRPDGGPRVHPICPLLADNSLYGFIVPGPKLADLRRDGRYALHSETFPPPREDDAFYITGQVREVHNDMLRHELKMRFFEERGGIEPWEGFEDQALIEFLVSTCLVTLTEARPDLSAGHTVWHADG